MVVLNMSEDSPSGRRRSSSPSGSTLVDGRSRSTPVQHARDLLRPHASYRSINPPLLTNAAQSHELEPLASWIPSSLGESPSHQRRRALRPPSPVEPEPEPPPPAKLPPPKAPPPKVAIIDKRMGNYEMMCRIEQIFNIVQEAASGAHEGLERGPSEQLDYLSRQLGPISDHLIAPLERFGENVDALTSSLMARDTSAEAKLAAIRHAVGKALERGRYGALEEMVPLDVGEAKAAEMRKQQEAAVQQEQEKWAKLRRLQQQERKEAEQALDELFFAQHDRGEEREGLMGQVQGWLDNVSEDLRDATGDNEAEQGGLVSDGKGSFASQRDFEVEMQIDKGRLAMEEHLADLARSGRCRSLRPLTAPYMAPFIAHCSSL